MQKTKFFLLTLLLLITPIIATAQSTNVTFDYTGLVRVSGTPYDGTGDFKLAIVSTNGMTTYWSNDGTSTAGSEPSTAISIPVTDGVFSINVGDTNLGMDPINRALFNTQPNALRLRIWFNDGSSGFEQLNPDRRLNNIELLGLTTGDGGLNIYVDAINGADTNDGLTTGTAKATVQAGVDIVPASIDSPTVITVFPGDYRELVTINNVSIGSSDGSFRIIGEDLGTTDTIRITGSDDDVSAVRDNIMVINSSDSMRVQGIHFDIAADRGVRVRNSEVTFVDCEFSNTDDTVVDMTTGAVVTLNNSLVRDSNNNGVSGFGNISLNIVNSTIQDINNSGVFVYDNARLAVTDSNIQNIGKVGVSLQTGAAAELLRTTVDNCGLVATSGYSIDVIHGAIATIRSCTIDNGNTGGIRSFNNGTVRFRDNGDGDTTISNCVTGIKGELSSTVIDLGDNAFTFGSGNTTNLDIDASSTTLNIP